MTRNRIKYSSFCLNYPINIHPPNGMKQQKLFTECDLSKFGSRNVWILWFRLSFFILYAIKYSAYKSINKKIFVFPIFNYTFELWIFSSYTAVHKLFLLSLKWPFWNVNVYTIKINWKSGNFHSSTNLSISPSALQIHVNLTFHQKI